jgi:hypothetical protein
MKNLVPIALVCLLISCTKSPDKSSTSNQDTEKEICTFGITSFNLVKREPVGEEASRKPPKGNGGGSTGGTPTTPPPPSTAVILLDFDGHLVSGTSWNYNGDFYCSSANMITSEMAYVLDRVTNDYSPFNVTVTLDENVFNAAPSNRRTRVIITESWEWFGQAGGTSFIGSFTSGSGNPSFVFSSMLNYTARNVAEAVSHEVGHTFGLAHQALYSGCTKLSDYNAGIGFGETGWGPIMGNAYSQNLTLWHRGPTASSCNTIQDEVSIIGSILGYKTDDHVNSITGATPFSTSASGLINTASDADFFYFSSAVSRTVSLSPFNAGSNNTGANTDLVLKLYSVSGTLLATVNDPDILNASIYVNPGSYYVGVSTAANTNTNTYGMLGLYSLNLY